MSEANINLTSSEIGALWTGFMQDSMSKQMLGFMLQHIEDKEIKKVVQRAYTLSSSHLEKLTSIFENEKFAIPHGFTEQDVNLDAPWLFSDIFCLTYVNHMSRAGMLAYSGFLGTSYREDICELFLKDLNETGNLYKQSLNTALQKGASARHPYIVVPKETDYIDSKKYYSGLNPFSSKRPLNAIEISHLYLNIITNEIGKKLCLAFAQTSHLTEVQDFMLRGKKTSQKHIKSFTNTLVQNDVETPSLPDIAISNSTTQTFSDKLMMFLMSELIVSGLGNYATAGAISQRNDLLVHYERLSLEVTTLAKSGADIMIKHHWLEQPPGTKDRKKLAKDKGSS